MELGLKGRPALVLGGGGGLGRAIAVSLAREGAIVTVADINPDAVAASEQAIRAAGGIAHGVLWDLLDIGGIDARVSEVEAKAGPVQILVNNTGGPPPTPVSGQDPAAWHKFFDMMVLSVVGITDRVLPGMRAAKWGRIITSTSSGVVSPIPNLGLSNALRLSLVGWSKTLAREVARDGITANIVLPGRVATDLGIPVVFANQCGHTETVIPILRTRITDRFAGLSSISDGRHGPSLVAGRADEVLIAPITIHPAKGPHAWRSSMSPSAPEAEFSASARS